MLVKKKNYFKFNVENFSILFKISPTFSSSLKVFIRFAIDRPNRAIKMRSLVTRNGIIEERVMKRNKKNSNLVRSMHLLLKQDPIEYLSAFHYTFYRPLDVSFLIKNSINLINKDKYNEVYLL